MIHIIDNFLDSNHLEYLESTHHEILPVTWYKFYEKHMYDDICHLMIKETKKYYSDIESIPGYECWSQINSKPDSMHYDKDETMWGEQKKLVFPLCSTVLYFNVGKDLSGGLLSIEDEVLIKPKTNRLVIFSPGLLHGVKEFKGKRSSLLVNPWKTRPMMF